MGGTSIGCDGWMKKKIGIKLDQLLYRILSKSVYAQVYLRETTSHLHTTLIIQRLLPPMTSRILRRIHNVRNPTRVETDNLAPAAIQRKRRDPRTARNAGLREVGKVLLKRYSNCIIKNRRVRPPIEGIRNVGAMNRGAYTPLIGVGTVLKGKI